jgi:hypothetical protein
VVGLGMVKDAQAKAGLQLPDGTQVMLAERA